MLSRKYDVPFWPKWVQDTIITALVLIGLVLVVLSLTGCTTTGQRLANVARPEPKSYAEAFRACVGDQTSNQTIITACGDAVKIDADRAKATAESAAKAAQSQVVVVPDNGYYNNSNSVAGGGSSYGTNVIYRTR